MRLNGQTVSQGGLFVEAPTAGWRPSWPCSRHGGSRPTRPTCSPSRAQPYYPLDAIPGATFTLDRRRTAIAIEVPPDAFASFSSADAGSSGRAPVAGTGGFLDYDLLYQAGDGARPGPRRPARARRVPRRQHRLSSFLLHDLTAGPSVIRLDTALSRDLPGIPDHAAARRQHRRAAARFAPPVRLAGCSTPPTSAPTRLRDLPPADRSAASRARIRWSTCSSTMCSARRARSRPGPSRSRACRSVTGAGEVQLRVTDLLGREQLVTQSYYVSSRLLKPGLHDFPTSSAPAARLWPGKLRLWRRLGQRHPSLRLQRPAHRRGAWRAASLDQQSLCLGGSYLLGRLGRRQRRHRRRPAAMAAPGVLGELAYEYDGRRFNFGARTRYTSDGFRQAGGDEEAARTDQLNLGPRLRRLRPPRDCCPASRRPRHRGRDHAGRDLQHGARPGRL